MTGLSHLISLLHEHVYDTVTAASCACIVDRGRSAWPLVTVATLVAVLRVLPTIIIRSSLLAGEIRSIDIVLVIGVICGGRCAIIPTACGVKIHGTYRLI